MELGRRGTSDVAPEWLLIFPSSAKGYGILTIFSSWILLMGETCEQRDLGDENPEILESLRHKLRGVGRSTLLLVGTQIGFPNIHPAQASPHSPFSPMVGVG